MTNDRTQIDAAGIPLAGEMGPSQQEYLRQQQHQLDRLTQAVSELMAGICRLVPPTPPLPAPPVTVQSRPLLLPQAHASPPEQYAGDPAGCRNFILECELYFSDFPERSATQRIAFMMQHLSSHALDWAAAAWRAGGNIAMGY